MGDIISSKPICPQISDCFDEFSNQVCNDFVPIYDAYVDECLNLRNGIIAQYTDLKDLTGYSSHSRQKRFVPLFALGSIVSMGLSLGNGFYTHKRIDQLEKGLEKLSFEQHVSNDRYLELRNDLTPLANISDHVLC